MKGGEVGLHVGTRIVLRVGVAGRVQTRDAGVQSRRFGWDTEKAQRAGARQGC